MASTVADTSGALLVGGFIAAVFSGIVTVQTAAYYKFYPSDRVAVKILVFFVWLCDLLHTAFIGRSLWYYLILNFGDHDAIDHIDWSLASTIAVTAVLTFCVHCFFVHRIFKLSERNYWVAAPLGLIALLRLFFACLTTAKLIMFRSFHRFAEQYHWSFTIGLALSSLLDVLITAFLCFFLMNGRKKGRALNDVLDSLVLYAFESGSLTSAATVLSMVFWLAMRTNLVFMGLHFVISKFYANSLLATLNTRRLYLQKAMSSGGLIQNSAEIRASKRTSRRCSKLPRPVTLQINVESSVIRTITDDKSTVILGNLDHLAQLEQMERLDRMYTPSPSPTTRHADGYAV